MILTSRSIPFCPTAMAAIEGVTYFGDFGSVLSSISLVSESMIQD